jgi:UPF0755 protein
MLRLLRLLAWSFFMAGLLITGLGGAGYWLYRDSLRAGPLAEPRTLVIRPHTGIAGIAQSLADGGVIRYELAFEVVARLSGRGTALKAGEYEFPAGTSPVQALDILTAGKTVKHRLTIPEGLTSAEIAALVRDAPALDGEVGKVPEEGELLPDTYIYSYGDSRSELLARMRHDMEHAVEQLWHERRPELPLVTPQEAVILASIVEKETAREEERPHVAGVYANRLRLGMRLQADPTVIYALSRDGGKIDRPLNHADLALNSPYNTYVNKGLPPGPIANPGKASLRAAMRPEHTEDLYFVADGSGGHIFAKTLADQTRNVAQYRRSAAMEPNGGPPIEEPPPPEIPPATAHPLGMPVPAAAPHPSRGPEQASHVRHCRPEPGHPCVR